MKNPIPTAIAGVCVVSFALFAVFALMRSELFEETPRIEQQDLTSGYSEISDNQDIAKQVLEVAFSVRRASPGDKSTELVRTNGEWSDNSDAFNDQLRARDPNITDSSGDASIGMLTDAELLDLSESGNAIASRYLAMRKARVDPPAALALYHTAAVQGSLVALDLSGKALSEIAGGQSLDDDTRMSLIREAYAQNIAALMLGYGPSQFEIDQIKVNHPDVEITAETCGAGIGLVEILNAERADLGLRPYRVMFGTAEIPGILGIASCAQGV